MTRTKKGAYALFTAAYAFFFSIAAACFWELLGIALGAAIDGRVIKAHPLFIPFCIIAALVAAVALVGIFAINLKGAERLGYTKKIWCVQFGAALVASIPAAVGWVFLFDFLQKTL